MKQNIKLRKLKLIIRELEILEYRPTKTENCKNKTNGRLRTKQYEVNPMANMMRND